MRFLHLGFLVQSQLWKPDKGGALSQIHQWSFCSWKWEWVMTNTGYVFFRFFFAFLKKYTPKFPLSLVIPSCWTYLYPKIFEWFDDTDYLERNRQDITAAAMRACRDAISSNSIPAFRRGCIPGVTFEQMKLQIKLGVPQSLQHSLDIERVKSIFPYGKIMKVDIVDGGLICSSGVHVEEIGDRNDDCYIVNAAIYVGY